MSRRVGNIIYDVLDPNTGEYCALEVVTKAYDGVTINTGNESAYIDGVIYRKIKSGEYVKRVIIGNIINPRWWGVDSNEDPLIESIIKPLADKLGAVVAVINEKTVTSFTELSRQQGLNLNTEIYRNGAEYKCFSSGLAPFIGGEGTHQAEDNVTQFKLPDNKWLRLRPINGKLSWSRCYNPALSNNENFDRMVRYARIQAETNTLLIDVESITFEDTITIPYNVVVEGINYYSEESTTFYLPKTTLKFDLDDDTKTQVQFSKSSSGGYLQGVGLRNVRIESLSPAYDAINAYELKNPSIYDVNIVGNDFLKNGITIQGCVMTVMEKIKIDSFLDRAIYLKSHSFQTTTTVIKNSYFRNSDNGVGYDSDPESGTVQFDNVIFEGIKKVAFCPLGAHFVARNIYMENIPLDGDAIAIIEVGTTDPERPSSLAFSLFRLENFEMLGKPFTYTSNDDPDSATVGIRITDCPQAVINNGRILNVSHPVHTMKGVDNLVYSNVLEHSCYKHSWEDGYNGWFDRNRVTITNVKGMIWNTGLKNIQRNLEITDFLKLGQLVLPSNPPSSASDMGVKNEIRRDDDYIYVCVDTDTWKRIPLNSW